MIKIANYTSLKPQPHVYYRLKGSGHCSLLENSGMLLGSELLPEAKEFKYLEVLFTSDWKIECEMD